MSFGKELMQSAHEALDIAAGKAAPAGMFVPQGVDVATIRKRQKLSLAAFAKRYGLPLDTVRDWERNRLPPDPAAAALLRLIDQKPDLVAAVLAAP